VKLTTPTSAEVKGGKIENRIQRSLFISRSEDINWRVRGGERKPP
jgi:hypothetical protein